MLLVFFVGMGCCLLTCVCVACSWLAASHLRPASTVGYPPVEAREEKKGNDGKPAAQESLISLLVNDCLKWVWRGGPVGKLVAIGGAGRPS